MTTRIIHIVDSSMALHLPTPTRISLSPLKGISPIYTVVLLALPLAKSPFLVTKPIYK